MDGGKPEGPRRPTCYHLQRLADRLRDTETYTAAPSPMDMSLTRKPNGCWTCKSRKIGCDKIFPSCNNCTRTGRVCRGYGIKLHWPESGDGRRPSQKWNLHGDATNFLHSRRGAYHFLSTTSSDVCHAKRRLHWGKPLARSQSLSKPISHGCDRSLPPGEAVLISYYHEVLSCMITTINDSENGFRNILLPIALSGSSLASQALRKAIVALSAFHLHGEKSAIPYKVSSIKLLSKSFQYEKEDFSNQFATCMMLCVCDVFDSADGSWFAHMKAAEYLSTRLSKSQGSDFLLSWLAYHAVLADFSGFCNQAPELIIPRLPRAGFNKDVVIGSLGCSTQVLESISCITSLCRLSRHKPIGQLSERFVAYPTLLLHTLKTLTQRVIFRADCTRGNLDSTRIHKTAELYRIAALIYLSRSVLGISTTADEVQTLVTSALQIMAHLHVCTSPWPIFVVACEVIIDEHRIEVLNALTRMQEERRIGNVEIMASIIEALWIQRDLGNHDDNWRNAIETSGRLPSFI